MPSPRRSFSIPQHKRAIGPSRTGESYYGPAFTPPWEEPAEITTGTRVLQIAAGAFALGMVTLWGYLLGSGGKLPW